MYRTLLVAVLLCIVSWTGVVAQTTDAVLSGTITDPSGAPMPDAKISAQNTATGVASVTRSNHAGVYLFPALPPGDYSLAAEHDGFRRVVVSRVQLQ